MCSALFLAACVHHGTKAAASTAVSGKDGADGKAAKDHKVVLAVLPAESDHYRKVAGALNQRLPGLRLRGVSDYFVSKATLEVVQISIECIDDSTECLTAAGKSISANRLLIARVSGGRKKPVSVTVTLFDVDSGSEVHSATSKWKTQKLAVKGIPGLIDEALGSELLAPASDATASAAPTKKRHGGSR